MNGENINVTYYKSEITNSNQNLVNNESKFIYNPVDEKTVDISLYTDKIFTSSYHSYGYYLLTYLTDIKTYINNESSVILKFDYSDYIKNYYDYLYKANDENKIKHSFELLNISNDKNDYSYYHFSNEVRNLISNNLGLFYNNLNSIFYIDVYNNYSGLNAYIKIPNNKLKNNLYYKYDDKSVWYNMSDKTLIDIDFENNTFSQRRIYLRSFITENINLDSQQAEANIYVDKNFKYSIGGNIMSLIYNESYKEQYSMYNSISYLSYNETNLISAKRLMLPCLYYNSDTNNNNYYAYMFSGCINLREAPIVIPIDHFGKETCCYMFNNCKSLQSINLLSYSYSPNYNDTYFLNNIENFGSIKVNNKLKYIVNNVKPEMWNISYF